jgi:hypothetical protein
MDCIAKKIHPAMALTIIALARAAFADDEGEELGPGCAPDRAAVSHHAGGVIVEHHGDTNVIPCATNTGWRTSETAIAVTNRGTVLLQPAVQGDGGLPIGLLRSTNRGRDWHFLEPGVQPARAVAIDMNIWVDRQTGRIFWSNDLIPPIGTVTTQRVDHSDDDGRTWSRSAELPVFFDHTQIFSGPPPQRLRHAMRGYPNVVYVVVSGGFTCAAVGFCGTHITRSLDGALTFDPPVAFPYPPECPAPGVNPTGGYGLNGVVDREGTVYVPFTPCERPYIAVSHDGGETWYLVLVGNVETIGWGELALGTDSHRNLYASWTARADRLLYFSISRDQGSHWSTPMMIAAPGVNEAAIPILVTGETGQVAVTYYGSRNAPMPFPTPCSGYSLGCPGYENETWDTYVTETFNPLDRQPLFFSATLNDPANPTWFGMSPSSMRFDDSFATGTNAGTTGGVAFGDRLDYYSATMSRDGTPWVGFTQECPLGLPVPGNPNCPDSLAGDPTDGLFALVGRVVRVERHHHGDD